MRVDRQVVVAGLSQIELRSDRTSVARSNQDHRNGLTMSTRRRSVPLLNVASKMGGSSCLTASRPGFVSGQAACARYRTSAFVSPGGSKLSRAESQDWTANGPSSLCQNWQIWRRFSGDHCAATCSYSFSSSNLSRSCGRTNFSASPED